MKQIIILCMVLILLLVGCVHKPINPCLKETCGNALCNAECGEDYNNCSRDCEGPCNNVNCLNQCANNNLLTNGKCQTASGLCQYDTVNCAYGCNITTLSCNNKPIINDTPIINVSESKSDFRNFYGISWVGTSCENLAYAKSMGYDYVVYSSRGGTSMKNCPTADKKDMHFYVGQPEESASADYAWEITTTKTYTQAEIDKYNPFFAWKGNSTNLPFPQNLATGWWFSTTSFRPNADYQQQKIIDWSVLNIISKVKSYEDLANNFTFGGYSWDVPSYIGDWWTARQNTSGHSDCIGNSLCVGKIVNLGAWNNGVESSALHSGITHEYAKYSEGRIALFKKLFNETRKIYPDLKLYYQPYHLYTDFIDDTEIRADKLELMPPNSVFLCQESAYSSTNELEFLTDSRIYNSGLITKSYVCNDNPDNHDQARNLNVAANAAINGAWTGWYGRFGGTQNAIAYTSITLVPNRLKMVRIFAGWDNLHNINLTSRHWDSANKIYTSPNTYADMHKIYSRHPKNNNIYVVFIDGTAGTITLNPGETYKAAYTVNGLFQKVSRVDSDFVLTGNVLSLTKTVSADTAYIIEVR